MGPGRLGRSASNGVTLLVAVVVRSPAVEVRPLAVRDGVEAPLALILPPVVGRLIEVPPIELEPELLGTPGALTVSAVVGVVGVSGGAETPGPTLTATGRAAEAPELLAGEVPPERLVGGVPIEEAICTI